MNPITFSKRKRSGLTMSALLLALVAFTLFPYQGSAQSYSGPVVITKGGTYTGNWESRDTNVPAIEVNTDQPVVIINSNIRGAGAWFGHWAGEPTSLSATRMATASLLRHGKITRRHEDSWV